jgi:hypothetical protein
VINPRAAVRSTFRSNLRVTLFGLLLAVSGCEKANDVPRLQDEARATAKAYQERFDELGHRAEAISKRGNTLRVENSVDAQVAYRAAVTTLGENRRILQGLPARIDASGGTGDPDALPKLIDSVRERFENAVRLINWNLDAVESWIHIAERQQNRWAASPPAAPNAAGTVPAGAPQPTGAEATIR